MAFISDDLQAIGPPIGNVSDPDTPTLFPGIFSYGTNDTAATVAGTDYFLAAIDRLPLHSILIVVEDIDGTPGAEMYRVDVNDGTTIDATRFV